MARNLGTLEYLVDIDTSGVYAGAAEVEAVLKSIPDEKVNLEIDTNVESLRKARSELVKYQKLLKGAMDGKKLDMRTKAFRRLPQDLREFITESGDAEAALKRITSALDRNAAGLSAWTYKQREASNATRQASKATKDKAKNDAEAAKQIRAHAQEVAKLKEKYAKLDTQYQRMQRNPFARDTELEIRQYDRLGTELAAIRQRYIELGGSAEDLNVKFDRNSGQMSKFLRSIGKVRVNLGLFSLSIRQLVVALSTFGPIVSGLVGALSALAGTVGTGLVSAFGLASAAAGGFLLNLIGIGTAIKPLFEELQTATKAATDYYKQVLKTGKGSEEAADKLEDYRQTVRNLPPDTQRLIQESGKLVTEWSKVTDALRRPFFRIAGVGIQSLSKLMPMFAMETKRSFKFVTGSFVELAQALGRSEAQSIFQNLMRQSSRSVPGIVSGIGSIATAIGRLANISANFLPRISQTFSRWAEGLADSTKGVGFASGVRAMFDQLRAVGRLLTSTGRLLITFFSAGAGAGLSFTNSLTRTIKSWTNWMRSIEGQETLAQFFSASLREVQLLYSALSPIIKTFGRITEAVRPISQLILQVVAAFGSLAEVISRSQLVTQTLAAVLGARIFFGAISGAVALTAALGKLLLVQRAFGIAQLAMHRGLGTSAVAMGRVALSSKNLYIAAALLAGYGIYKVIESIKEQNQALEITRGNIKKTQEAYEDLKDSLDDLTNATNQTETAGQSAVDAWKRVDELAQAGRRGTQEWRQAILDATAAERAWGQAQRDRNAAANEAYHKRRKELEQASATEEDALERVANAFGANTAETIRNTLVTGGNLKAAWRNSEAVTALGEALKNTAEAQSRNSLFALNLNRAWRGLTKLAGPGVVKVLGQIDQSYGKVARKQLKQRISVEEDPRLAVNLAAVAAKLSKVGGPQGRKAVKLAVQSDKSNAQVFKTLRRELDQLAQKTGKNGKLEANFSLAGNPVKTIKDLRAKLDELKKPRKLDLVTQDAQRRLDEVKAKINSIPPERTLRLNIVERRTDGDGVGNATGGSALYMNREAAGAPTQGGRYSKPSFLVGEENRPEYVIATNPSYRRSNIKYWMQAGAALGIPGFKDGGATAAGKPPSNNGGKRTLAQLETLYRKKQATVTRNTELAALHRRQEDLRQNQGLPFRSQRIEGPLTAVWKATGVIKSLFKPIISKYGDKIKAVSKSDLKKDKKKVRIRELEDKQREYKQARKNYDITVANAEADLNDFKNEMATGGGGLGASPAVTEALNLLSGNYGLGMQYGSNMFAASAGIGPSSGIIAPGGSVDPSPRSRSAGKVVNVTNNYQEPPADPHTWSKQLEWEVGVA